ncbi:hypothetical protein [Paenibacillus sp. R14(2021)]
MNRQGGAFALSDDTLVASTHSCSTSGCRDPCLIHGNRIGT